MTGALIAREVRRGLHGGAWMPVAFFLLVHAVWGWCPPTPILRRLGLRTRAEIDYDRYALKNLRGDFTSLPKAPPERVDMYQAEQVLAAVMK